MTPPIQSSSRTKRQKKLKLKTKRPRSSPTGTMPMTTKTMKKSGSQTETTATFSVKAITSEANKEMMKVHQKRPKVMNKVNQQTYNRISKRKKTSLTKRDISMQRASCPATTDKVCMSQSTTRIRRKPNKFSMNSLDKSTATKTKGIKTEEDTMTTGSTTTTTNLGLSEEEAGVAIQTYIGVTIISQCHLQEAEVGEEAISTLKETTSGLIEVEDEEVTKHNTKIAPRHSKTGTVFKMQTCSTTPTLRSKFNMNSGLITKVLKTTEFTSAVAAEEVQEVAEEDMNTYQRGHNNINKNSISQSNKLTMNE